MTECVKLDICALHPNNLNPIGECVLKRKIDLCKMTT